MILRVTIAEPGRGQLADFIGGRRGRSDASYEFFP
jgi:hypothetical protein